MIKYLIAASLMIFASVPSFAGSLTVNLLRAENNQGVSGAVVKLMGGGQELTQSADSNGSATFSSVAPGQYLLEATAENYSYASTISQPANVDFTLNIALESVDFFSLPLQNEHFDEIAEAFIDALGIFDGPGDSVSPPPGVVPSEPLPPSLPTLSVSDSSPMNGGQVTIFWTGINPTGLGDWIGLVAAGSSYSWGNPWIYTSGTSSYPGAVPASSGSVNFVIPSNLAVGQYQLIYHFNDGYTEAARSAPFTIGAPSASIPPVDPAPADYSCGGGILCDGSPVTGTPGQQVCGSDLRMYSCTSSGWVGLGTECSCSDLIPAPAPAPDPVVPAISVSNASPRSGDQVTISWASLNSTYLGDWIGLATADSWWVGWGDTWIYTGGTTSYPSASPGTSGSVIFTIPSNMPSGQYQFVYYFNDSYTEVARSAPFTISP